MSWRLSLSRGLFFCVAACCSTSFAAVDSGTTYARDLLMPYVESGELPGAISVFCRAGVQETACIGYADVESRRPISMDDLFKQCSQTKGFCGVTVARLVEEGRISIDDPVSKYLPEFRTLWVETCVTNGVRRLERAKGAPTIRMCMNHTAGFDFELPFREEVGGWSRRAPLRSVAAMAANLPLAYEPGTQAKYSNLGIDVSAAIVEKVTGLRWEDYLRRIVLEPLGMTNTVFRPSARQLSRRIVEYDVRGGQRAVARKVPYGVRPPYDDDRVFPSAGAGLWTTANDQLKFYKMLMNIGVGENGVRILKEETVKDLLAKSTRPKALGCYSLGLTAPYTDSGEWWFGHGGALGSCCMVNWHRKELKLWVVQQVGKPRPWEEARDRAERLFFRREIDNKEANSYTGRTK